MRFVCKINEFLKVLWCEFNLGALVFVYNLFTFMIPKKTKNHNFCLLTLKIVVVSKAKVVKETPLMKQYNQIKAKYPDALLLFRIGDFYETFGEDAIKAAGVLGIVLTHRNNGGDRTELAGFPHHSLNTYLPKLVKAGMRVAICDQLEDPKQTKTIVKRGVTELITPGVALNDDILHARTNNFLAALWQGKHSGGFLFRCVNR